MKKILLLFVSVLCLTTTTNAKECYVFSKYNVALEALEYINNIGIFPITPVNAKTGVLNHNAQKTTSWDIINIRSDGLFYFERLPSDIIRQQDIEKVDYFLNTYSPSIEKYESNWDM